jgi:hypothetical protein
MCGTIRGSPLSSNYQLQLQTRQPSCTSVVQRQEQTRFRSACYLARIEGANGDESRCFPRHVTSRREASSDPRSTHLADRSRKRSSTHSRFFSGSINSKTSTSFLFNCRLIPHPFESSQDEDLSKVRIGRQGRPSTMVVRVLPTPDRSGSAEPV